MNRITRLACARVYFFGLYGSIPALHRLMGLPFRGLDWDPGIDRRLVLFHSIQSVFLSLTFLTPAAWIYWYAPAVSEVDTMVLFLLCFLKIAVLNSWIARGFFRNEKKVASFRLPLLGRLAAYLSARLYPLSASVGTVRERRCTSVAHALSSGSAPRSMPGPSPSTRRPGRMGRLPPGIRSKIQTWRWKTSIERSRTRSRRPRWTE